MLKVNDLASLIIKINSKQPALNFFLISLWLMISFKITFHLVLSFILWFYILCIKKVLLPNYINFRYLETWIYTRILDIKVSFDRNPWSIYRSNFWRELLCARGAPPSSLTPTPVSMVREERAPLFTSSEQKCVSGVSRKPAAVSLQLEQQLVIWKGEAGWLASQATAIKEGWLHWPWTPEVFIGVQMPSVSHEPDAGCAQLRDHLQLWNPAQEGHSGAGWQRWNSTCSCLQKNQGLRSYLCPKCVTTLQKVLLNLGNQENTLECQWDTAPTFNHQPDPDIKAKLRIFPLLLPPLSPSTPLYSRWLGGWKELKKKRRVHFCFCTESN